MELSEIQHLVYQECINNGYVKMWNKHGKIGDIAELGLILSEVSEAMEEIRNKKTDYAHISEECADIIIRTLNFMSRKYLDSTLAILEKHDKNMKRTTLHGRDV